MRAEISLVHRCPPFKGQQCIRLYVLMLLIANYYTLAIVLHIVHHWSYRSPRKGLFSPKNLVTASSRQVFGFDAPSSSTPPTTTTLPFATLLTTPPLCHSKHKPVITNGFNASPVVPMPQNAVADSNDYNYAVDGPYHQKYQQVGFKTGLLGEDSLRSGNSVSPAISAKSMHANRKISPPINRPEHLRFS